jgi:hypothetical protein
MTVLRTYTAIAGLNGGIAIAGEKEKHICSHPPPSFSHQKIRLNPQEPPQRAASVLDAYIDLNMASLTPTL